MVKYLIKYSKILKSIYGIQENIEKYLNIMRRIIQYMNEIFTSEVEILRKNLTEILGWKDLSHLIILFKA